MKILKKLLLLIIALIAFLLFIAYLVVENNVVLNYVLKEAIKISKEDVVFNDIKGGFISGIEINELNYQNKIKISLKLEINYVKLLLKTFEIETLEIVDISIDKNYLNTLLENNETNTEENSSKNKLLVIPYLKDVKVKNILISTKEIAFREYLLNSLYLNIKDVFYDLNKTYKAEIKNLTLLSNVADINLTASTSSPFYEIFTNIEPKIPFISKFLNEQNITLQKLPTINIQAKGNFDQLDLNSSLDKVKLSFQNFVIEPQKTNLLVNFDIKNNNLVSNLKTLINSNIAILNLDLNSSLNLNDINSSLKYKADTNILVNRDFIKQNYLKDINLTIKEMPNISFTAKGNLKNINLNSFIYKGRVVFNEFDIKPNFLNITSNYNLLNKDLKSLINGKIDSNIANIKIDSKVSLNTNNIDKSLKYSLFSKIFANKNFIYQKTKDLNLTINQLQPIKLNIDGDLSTLKANANLALNGKFQDISISPKVKELNVDFDIKSSSVKGDLKLNLLSSIADIYTKSDFDLNLKNIEKSLKYQTNIGIKNTNIKEVNLKSLEPFNLKASGGIKSINSKLSSPKIDLTVNSFDMQKFNINLQSKNINLKEMIKFPDEVLIKFVNLNLNGFYDIAGEADILGDLNINNNLNFKIKALQKSKNIDLKIDNETLNLKANGSIEPLNIDSSLEINSLKNLQKTIKKLYTFDNLNIGGKIALQSKIKKEDILIELQSPKIKYNEINIKNFLTKINYAPNEFLIKKLEFTTSGFSEKDLNRDFKLSQDGVIKLGDNIIFDISFNKMIDIQGFKNQNNTNIDINLIKFPLALKEYGKLKINSQMTFKQKNDKNYLIGAINLYDVNLNYESKFLSIDKDNDIVIITKKDKELKKENRKKMSDFEKNFFMDLKIKSLNKIIYKIEGAEIKLDLNLALKKEFEDNVRILGKIENINGFYDFKGKKFLIENSLISMRGLKEINPLLDIKLKYSLPEITIYIYVRGDKNRPKIKFLSEPLMSQKEIFSYLIFGTSSENIGKGNKSGNYDKTVALFFSNSMTKDVAESLGLDKIELNEGKDGKGVDVQVSKRISRNLVISYKNSTAKNSIKLEYELNKNWGVESENGDDVNSVDLFFKKKY